MEAMIFVRSFGVGVCCVVDKGPSPSVHRPWFGDDNRLVSRPFQFETCPVVRNSLSTIVPEHVPLCCGQRPRDGVPLGQMSIEAFHEIERGGIVDGPQCGNNGLCPGKLKSEGEICDTFFAL